MFNKKVILENRFPIVKEPWCCPEWNPVFYIKSRIWGKPGFSRIWNYNLRPLWEITEFKEFQGHKVEFLNGTIFNQKFIEREKSFSSRVSTIALDLDNTLMFYNFESKNSQHPARYYLRPGIEEQLQILQNSGIRMVIWTSAAKDYVKDFFQQHPFLAKYVHLVIARENYCAIWDATFQKMLKIYNITKEQSVVTIPLAKHSQFDTQVELNFIKNISLLGYKLIVDNQDLNNESQVSPTGSYKTYKSQYFGAYDFFEQNKNQKEVDKQTKRLAKDILDILGGS